MPSTCEMSPSTNNNTGNNIAKKALLMCLTVSGFRYSFPENSATTPIAKVRSATLAPKITPKPSAELPSKAAITPIDSSGSTAIMPAIITLMTNSGSLNNCARFKSRFIASSALTTTITKPTMISKSGIKTMIYHKDK